MNIFGSQPGGGDGAAFGGSEVVGQDATLGTSNNVPLWLISGGNKRIKLNNEEPVTVLDQGVGGIGLNATKVTLGQDPTGALEAATKQYVDAQAAQNIFDQPLNTIDDVLFNKATVTTDVQVNGDIKVEGNVTVNGVTTTLNTQNLDVKDRVITVNSGETGSGVSGITAGFTVDRGTLPNTNMVWNDSVDAWELIDDTNAYNTLYGGDAKFTSLDTVELKNTNTVNGSAITDSQWGHVATMDQDVGASDTVDFAQINSQIMNIIPVTYQPSGVDPTVTLPQDRHLKIRNGGSGSGNIYVDMPAHPSGTHCKVTTEHANSTWPEVRLRAATGAILYEIFRDGQFKEYNDSNGVYYTLRRFNCVKIQYHASGRITLVDCMRQGDITNTQWNYLESSDQGFTTTDDVQFASVDTVELKNTNTVNGATITDAQWNHVGTMDQDVAQASNVTFNDVTTTGHLVPDQFTEPVYNYTPTGDGVLTPIDENHYLVVSGNSAQASPKKVDLSNLVFGRMYRIITGHPQGTQFYFPAGTATLQNQTPYSIVTDTGLGRKYLDVTARWCALVIGRFSDNRWFMASYSCNFTQNEILQLRNINNTTIDSAQWGYLGALDQPLSTGDDVTFASVAADTKLDTKELYMGDATLNRIEMLGANNEIEFANSLVIQDNTLTPRVTINGATDVTVQPQLKCTNGITSFGNFNAQGTGFTVDPATQTQMKGRIISTQQWDYLGTQDQPVDTFANVTFADVSATGLLTAAQARLQSHMNGNVKKPPGGDGLGQITTSGGDEFELIYSGGNIVSGSVNPYIGLGPETNLPDFQFSVIKIDKNITAPPGIPVQDFSDTYYTPSTIVYVGAFTKTFDAEYRFALTSNTAGSGRFVVKLDRQDTFGPQEIPTTVIDQPLLNGAPTVYHAKFRLYSLAPTSRLTFHFQTASNESITLDEVQFSFTQLLI